MSVLTPHLLYTLPASMLCSPYKSAYNMLAQSVVLQHHSIGSPANQSPALPHGDHCLKLHPQGSGTEFKETEHVGDRVALSKSLADKKAWFHTRVNPHHLLAHKLYCDCDLVCMALWAKAGLQNTRLPTETWSQTLKEALQWQGIVGPGQIRLSVLLQDNNKPTAHRTSGFFFLKTGGK